MIIRNCVLNAVRYSPYLNYRHFESTENKITIFNFNKEESLNIEEFLKDFKECGEKNTHVFCLNKQGYFRKLECFCNEINKNIPTNEHYFISNSPIPFKEIFQGFSKRGVKVRNCFVCKFSKRDNWDMRICVLYKKYNLERKPNPYNALKCPYYCEDKFVTQTFDEPSPQTETYKSLYYICKEIL